MDHSYPGEWWVHVLHSVLQAPVYRAPFELGKIDPLRRHSEPGWGEPDGDGGTLLMEVAV